jgi:hypothetical protein
MGLVGNKKNVKVTERWTAGREILFGTRRRRDALLCDGDNSRASQTALLAVFQPDRRRERI